MAKPLYVYTGSQWVPVASELESTSQYATTTYVDNKVGLDHIHTETFSAASTVSVNNVFSSTYKAYKIIIDHSASTALNTTIRLRSSGADDTNANYLRQYLLATGATVSGGRVSAQTSWTLNAPVNNRASAEFLIINPFETLATTAQCINAVDYTSNNLIIADSYAYTTTTSFDGLSLIASTGNITGFISIYGYKD